VTSLCFAKAVGKQSPVESHEDRQRIAEFLQEQKALQGNLLGSLRKDPYVWTVQYVIAEGFRAVRAFGVGLSPRLRDVVRTAAPSAF
jgi:hypothetical protein